MEAFKNSLELEDEEPESTLKILEDAQGALKIVEEGGQELDTRGADVHHGARRKRSPMQRLFHRDQYASYRELAQRHLEDDPTNDEVRVKLGAALHELGDHAGAQSLLEGSLGSDVPRGKSRFALGYLGHIGRALGDYAGSEQHYREALRRDPQRGGHVFIGALLAIQG
ncbi:MAG: hypothetical protein V3T22_03505, partial [Planctomycetota bacterium]